MNPETEYQLPFISISLLSKYIVMFKSIGKIEKNFRIINVFRYIAN